MRVMRATRAFGGGAEAACILCALECGKQKTERWWRGELDGGVSRYSDIVSED